MKITVVTQLIALPQLLLVLMGAVAWPSLPPDPALVLASRYLGYDRVTLHNPYHADSLPDVFHEPAGTSVCALVRVAAHTPGSLPHSITPLSPRSYSPVCWSMQ